MTAVTAVPDQEPDHDAHGHRGGGEPLEVFAYHRVDTARGMMHEPRRAAEATGRLFFAKRVHERAKAAAGTRPAAMLDEVLAEVSASLADPRAQEGARKEHAVFLGAV